MEADVGPRTQSLHSPSSSRWSETYYSIKKKRFTCELHVVKILDRLQPSECKLGHDFLKTWLKFDC